MNKFVALWNRHRPVDSRDAIQIDDKKFAISEAIEMADRQRPEGADARLPKNQFQNVIRFISAAPLSQVLELRAITYSNLKRLGVKRDTDMAFSFNAKKGSAQTDVGSIAKWMSFVSAKEKKAIAQILIIDATCCARG